MGSGISLSREQIIQLIKYVLEKDFNNKLNSKIKYAEDGYLIYETFDEEVEFLKKIRILNSLLLNNN